MSSVQSNIYPTVSDTSVLDYNSNPSVKKYQYDEMSATAQKAQPVDDNYYEIEQHPHHITIKWKVQTYTWSFNNMSGGIQNVIPCNDLSDKVIDVSYTCDSSSNIKQNASLKLLVPPDDDYWYANREYDIHIATANGSHGQSNTIWMPQIYKIEEIMETPLGMYTRNFGFFIPENTGYVYDQTTSELTITLYGLSYQFTAEGGGVLVTAIKSFDYFFDMPYNNSPTSIISYLHNNSTEVSTQEPVTKTAVDIEKENLMQQEQSVYQQIPSFADFGGTAEILPNQTQGKKEINVPYSISFSGYNAQTGALETYSGLEIGSIIYKIVMCQYDWIMNNYRMPLTEIQYPSADAEFTAKSDIFPNGWDFDNGADIMTIAQTIMSDRYYEPMIYVDEDRQLCLKTVPTYKNTWRSGIFYKDYADLIISEDISINDNEFYDVVEVYGKDGECYGVCDASESGFKEALGNSFESISANLNTPWLSKIPKTKVITDTNLETDVQCFNLAIYEMWKATRGHVTINVKFRDNYIPKLYNISHIVGETFVEYKTIQGGKSLCCLLRKATLSNGIWSWELEPFDSFAPAYDWNNAKIYVRFKTEHYDQFLSAQWNSEKEQHSGEGDTYITEKTKHTLAQPVIIAWQLIDNHILRLFVSSIDIGFGVVKIWTSGNSGTYNEGIFLGESSLTNGTDSLPWGSPHAKSVNDILDGQHIYKIFDYPITQNGTYTFSCQLYSVFYENSVAGNSTSISIGNYIDPDTGTIAENTSVAATETIIDPETGEITTVTHKPYLVNELQQKLTTENSERLTI